MTSKGYLLPYFWNLSTSSGFSEELWDLFVDFGLAWTETPWSHSANGTKTAFALRGFQRRSAQVCLCILYILVLWPRRGRNGGAIFPCSAVSPMCPLIILTPFCTQCHAVEHENKKHPASSQPSVQTRVSEWVAPKASVLSPASSLVFDEFL